MLCIVVIGQKKMCEVTKDVPESFQRVGLKMLPPLAELCTEDFGNLKVLKPPFRLSLVGIMMNKATEIQRTVQGDKKVTFRLVDTKGNFVEVGAIGRHAEQVSKFSNGFQIAMHNAAFRLNGKGSGSAVSWLWSDSYVFPISKVTPVPPLKNVFAEE